MQPPPPPPPEPYGCTALGLGPNSLSCLDLSLLLLYIFFLAGLIWAAVHWRVFAHSSSRNQADSSAIDSSPLLESEEGEMREWDTGAEESYSPLEQRLRPTFYKLVRQQFHQLCVCAVPLALQLSLGPLPICVPDTSMETCKSRWRHDQQCRHLSQCTLAEDARLTRCSVHT